MTMNAPSNRPIALVAASEADLIDGIKQHREEAVRELLRRFNPRLFRVARGLLDNDAEAEEAVQDAYLAALTKLDQFRGQATLATWLTRVTINAALTARRRSRRERQPYDTIVEREIDSATILPFSRGSMETAESISGRSEMRQVLEEAIGELPTDLRIVFVLREAEGMSVLAIASDLSLNPITVKTRLFRARHRLRVSLGGVSRADLKPSFPSTVRDVSS